MKQVTKHIRSLDGVRAIAALLILWLHYWSVAEPADSVISFLKKTSTIGQVGVPLFFVLSGFLITRILISNKDDSHYFSNFYIKRSLRIFPLYYLFLVIVFYLYPLIINTPVVPFNLSWPNWIYLQNFAITFNWDYQGPNHLWSLAVEEHFYLLWPLIVYFTNVRQLRDVCIAICIIEPVIRFFLFSNNTGVFYLSFARLDELSFGALLAVFEFRQKKIKSSVLFSVGAVSLILLAFCFTSRGEGNIWVQVFKFSLMGVFFHVLLSVLVFKRATVIEAFFSNGVLTYIGKISYGLYVYHPFAYILIEKHFRLPNVRVNFVTSVGLSFLFSIVSYNLFERQFLKYKERFNKNNSETPDKNNTTQLVIAASDRMTQKLDVADKE